MMVRSVLAFLVVAVLAAPAQAEKAVERLGNAAEVLDAILDIPEGIPQELIDKAECVGVIPSVKKFAIGIGGSYGRGAFVCRQGKNFTGAWSPPAMYRLEGANIGFQLGGQATDFVFLVMNPNGVDSLLKTKTKLGADAAVAAGPKGRTATAATDAYLRAEILTYSRSRGLFAGISLEGSTLRPDGGANEDIYGRKISAREILRQQRVSTPRAGQELVSLLQRHSPKNLSDPKSLRN